MFNVGGGEVLVILLVALIVLGPDKLPGAVRSVGNMVGELRKLSNGFQAEMRNAMTVDDRPRTGPVVGSTATEATPTPDPTGPTVPNQGVAGSSATEANRTEPGRTEPDPPPEGRRANDALFGPAPDERRPNE